MSPFVRSPMRGHDVPDERRLALLGDPRLEVVGRHDAREAVLLGERRVLDDLLRPELLEHRRVADLGLGHRQSISIWVRSGSTRKLIRCWVRNRTIDAAASSGGS